ncbi:hypothetical protein A3A71_00770 [Candidatus Berkelbacteria bacterium RIFCSPLOWO2_01_FULL_50_28]|uniref:DUF2127 domain-containing protein n=1 Tax=Candidatus Berkelbacteria bacterium RIFCSPLOWO2_01_FULL_50_28 TaxID=1797471 RepID=A0A1F5EBI3_9BACT|nr:MAG: hypothetical protein A2807_00945 [Candidatus Berkelbacteria bacterium RIFCSPHIGHO2_01_FULL_50_36]OGD62885.1 MAG: hypothetical protein A3F39_03950 [Candidatus Berkelbacteria bacterium RIFCSPHIGHO2_12_FULL_50_11]OGD64574.1 MAG: hypothetical protein A3A71_00770 [Candidatus Berkelbacteria bacterium RIFCSPLOWO2_01_FULL_50_28]
MKFHRLLGLLLIIFCAGVVLLALLSLTTFSLLTIVAFPMMLENVSSIYPEGVVWLIVIFELIVGALAGWYLLRGRLLGLKLFIVVGAVGILLYLQPTILSNILLALILLGVGFLTYRSLLDSRQEPGR